MELQLLPGAPADLAGRPAREARSYALLDRLGVAYCRVEHEPAATMAVCGAIDRALNAMICKNLFLCNRQQTAFYLLLIPGSKIFQTRVLSQQLGVARLSFGTPDRMAELLDVHPGSVSVLALASDRENRVQLVMDRAVAESRYFGCHPCENTASLRLSTADLLQTVLPALHHTPTFVTL